MAMVVVDASCLKQADSHPKSCGLVWGSAAAWRCSTFTRWTEWTLAMTWSWWQHYKYRRGYYYYYYIQYTQSMNFNDTHVCIAALQGLKINCATWNGFLKPDMLKHDHEHVLYFPTKNCSRSSSAWHGSQFLNHTYCMVPRWNWTKLRGLTLPLSDFLLLFCGTILPHRFWAPDTCWKTTLKGPEHRTTNFSAILRGVLDRADDARTLI